MPELRPFHGVRYSSPELRAVVCPPYDVISVDLQERLYERDPNNAVHIELPRGDEKYRNARATYDEWIRTGVLRRDPEASLYVYRQDFIDGRGERKRVTGVIGGLVLEPFGDTGGVLPHERTMPGPKRDRLALMHALPVNVSPIYAVYRGGGELSAFFDSLENRPTTARVQDDDRILHRLWAIAAPAEIDLLAGAVAMGPLVIADGHHRYETALALRDERAGEPGEHDAIMCFCVDADAADLVVLPYNRAVRASVSTNELADRLTETFKTEPLDAPYDVPSPPRGQHAFVFVLSDRALAVQASDDAVTSRLGRRAQAWLDLDVVALHEGVLPAVLGDAIEEMTFAKDPDEVVRLVRDDGWTAGVLLRALTAPQVVDVARSGERMPQKASYFWPKALTGLVFRPLI